MKNRKGFIKLLAIFLGLPLLSRACDELFEGFGIHLGSVDHFAASRAKMIPLVFHRIYNDLGIRSPFILSQFNIDIKIYLIYINRHFRTSYESTFSPSRDFYEIECGTSARICSWIDVHKEISKYQNISFMASVWSPPRFMINAENDTLFDHEEQNFHYFIRNITTLIKTKFNITVERVSPVNEPENIFAAWEHTRMVI